VSAESPDSNDKAPPNKGASSFIYKPSPENIRFLAGKLDKGELVAIPTETVYGLAGLALSETACRKIFSVKGRPLVDPLIVHVSGPEMVEELAFASLEFELLAEAFWPGPLTLILQKKPLVPDIVTAGKPTVAVRMPRHPVARELLSQVGAPLAAPSANPFGYISPSRAEHVSDSFGRQVPYILDGGPCEIGLESTILDISTPGHPVILRPGAISAAQVQDILRCPVGHNTTQTEEHQAARAPGTFARHYSPSTPLELFEDQPNRVEDREAVLYLKRPPEAGQGSSCFWLTEDGDLAEAARSLFAMLRTLDKAGYRAIHCQLPSEGGCGLSRALRDRMSRAAAR